MSIDPIGRGTYNGLGVPLNGESLIRQQNSSNTILTLMHSSDNTGRLLMGIDYKAGGDVMSSVLTDLATFDIDATGAFRGISGTTVNVELNSSGLFVLGDTVPVINSSKEICAHKKQTVTISSDGTTAYYLATSNAGKLHLVSTDIGTSVVIGLPTTLHEGLQVGMYWDIFSNTTAAGVIDIASIGVDKGEISLHLSTNDQMTTIAVTHATSGPFWVRVLCDSTADLKQWTISNFMGTNGSSQDGAYFGLSEGTSVLS
ncbi:unnamed protein product [marine sediment metagenome]|uniref:Uncharacterized protein n=1 Tax=marine sediment metagenome TaxID=412755 RepID=X0S446_9ZZZZ